MAIDPEVKLAMRRAERARRVADLADGRVQRAVRFPDKKKKDSREACRGKIRF